MIFVAFATLTVVALACIVPTSILASRVNYPAGAMIDATTRQEINTKTARDGDQFTLGTASGSTIYGHLSELARGAPTRKAHVKLNFDLIQLPDGTRAPLHATLAGVATKRKVNYGQGAAQAIGGTIVGNILGKQLGTNAGGLVGLAGGALLATNTAYDLVIPAGSEARLTLTAPLII
ncbi:MAG TPA: hypothetical protein VNF68_05795 [Candidatus Baltobacteraceae bacterium]|nr:hypothetical protein [Candidatus Baltobacteraceae bacterium]